MFRKLKDGFIESDRGFAIKIKGRAGLIYRENDSHVDINSEMLNDKDVGYVVETSSITHWKESGAEIDDVKKKIIIKNIQDAFKFLGYDVECIEKF